MTRSTQARKGYVGEAEVRSWLRSQGYRDVDRPRAGRHDDVGDISGLPLVVSVKNHATARPGQWVDELARLIHNAGTDTGVVIHKRRGKGNAQDWFVTMTGTQFAPFLAAYVAAQTTDRTP